MSYETNRNLILDLKKQYKEPEMNLLVQKLRNEFKSITTVNGGQWTEYGSQLMTMGSISTLIFFMSFPTESVALALTLLFSGIIGIGLTIIYAILTLLAHPDFETEIKSLSVSPDRLIITVKEAGYEKNIESIDELPTSLHLYISKLSKAHAANKHGKKRMIKALGIENKPKQLQLTDRSSAGGLSITNAEKGSLSLAEAHINLKAPERKNGSKIVNNTIVY